MKTLRKSSIKKSLRFIFCLSFLISQNHVTSLHAAGEPFNLAQKAQVATALLRGPLAIAAHATDESKTTQKAILSSLASSARISNALLALLNQKIC